MTDLLFEDDELVAKRFSCGCLGPGHMLDVSVEMADEGKRFVECSFEFYITSYLPRKLRLKRAWDMLRGKETCVCDFLLRPEDAGELIELLEKVRVK